MKNFATLAALAILAAVSCGGAYAAPVTFASSAVAGGAGDFFFNSTTGQITVGSTAFAGANKTNLTLGSSFFDGLAPAADYQVVFGQQVFDDVTVTLTGLTPAFATGGPGPVITEQLFGAGTLNVKSKSGHLLFGGTVSGLTIEYDGGVNQTSAVSTVNGVVVYTTGDLAPVLTIPESFSFTLGGTQFVDALNQPTTPTPPPGNPNELLNSFSASETGLFQNNSPGGIVGTPLPAAFAPSAGVLSLMALGLVARKRRVLSA